MNGLYEACLLLTFSFPVVDAAPRRFSNTHLYTATSFTVACSILRLARPVSES